MNKHTEIYGDKFGSLFVGIAPEGKILDTVATERGMQDDLDDAKQTWIDENPEPTSDDPRAAIDWDDARCAAFDQIGEGLSQNPEWYSDNYIWIDA